MPNPIKPKRSYTAGKVPRTTELTQNELAINWTDGRLFTKNASGQIVAISPGSAAPGVSSVNGRAGVVNITAADVTAASSTHAHNYVQVLNGQTGSINIIAGNNVNLTTASGSITIGAPPGAVFRLILALG